jgi:hypothetical protein
LIGAEGARLLREKQVKGDPSGLMLEEAPDRPRKASAWSGNQQASLTEPFVKVQLPLFGLTFIFLEKRSQN